MKDYYSILEIPPHAAPADIKKAYRRLAKQYHPDKTGNDPEASIRFRNVQEAYDVLSNPFRKNAYLQERWYGRAMGSGKESAGLTSAPEILLECVRLNRRVAGMDQYRINREKLASEMAALLSDERILILKQFDDPELIRSIVSLILECGHLLDFRTCQKIIRPLLKLSENDTDLRNAILHFEHRARKRKAWDTWKILLAFLLTGLICALMIRFAG